jgi:hypothetical protein
VGLIPVSAIDPRFYFHTHTLCAPGQLAEATRLASRTALGCGSSSHSNCTAWRRVQWLQRVIVAASSVTSDAY